MSTSSELAPRWREIATSLLWLGASSYGGPAIIGVMQTELQERRQWVSRQRFLEGLSVANMLPGATATQLGIFLAYARGGWWGGLVGGLCFVLPAFAVMLALSALYVTIGFTLAARDALYGLSPVVLALFAVAVYRLGRAAAASWREALLGIAAAVAFAASPLGIVAILVLAGGLGLLLFHPARRGRVTVIAVAVIGVVLAVSWAVARGRMGSLSGGAPDPGNLLQLGAYFFKVGAFTIGGGLTMIAFIQDQVVGEFGWLTPREFMDGLALGQLTPGPVLMIAAYVGYKLAGTAGAVVAASAAFVPSFVIMLVVLPVLERVRGYAWVTATMRGMAPAVIGVLVVSLARLAPIALPDPFSFSVFGATVVAVVALRAPAFPLIMAGAVLGLAKERLSLVPGIRYLGQFITG